MTCLQTWNVCVCACVCAMCWCRKLKDPNENRWLVCRRGMCVCARAFVQCVDAENWKIPMKTDDLFADVECVCVRVRLCHVLMQKTERSQWKPMTCLQTWNVCVCACVCAMCWCRKLKDPNENRWLVCRRGMCVCARAFVQCVDAENWKIPMKTDDLFADVECVCVRVRLCHVLMQKTERSQWKPMTCLQTWNVCVCACVCAMCWCRKLKDPNENRWLVCRRGMCVCARAFVQCVDAENWKIPMKIDDLFASHWDLTSYQTAHWSCPDQSIASESQSVTCYGIAVKVDAGLLRSDCNELNTIPSIDYKLSCVCLCSFVKDNVQNRETPKSLWWRKSVPKRI